MPTKVFCDLCKNFIAEYGMNRPKESGLNRPFVLSTYFEGKSLLDEDIGWSGPKEKLEFWACDKCNREFIDKLKKVAISMGLEI